MSANVDHLSLGGGVISLKAAFDDPTFIDMGFCHDFDVEITYIQSFKEKYVRGVGANIIKVLSSEGVLEGVNMRGSFICESLTRDRLQATWFRGQSVDTGTELLQLSTLEPIVSALHFLSVPSTGPTVCLILPKVEIKPTGPVSQILYDWKNVPFGFNILIEENFIPILRVQEVGEALPDFCV